jgi:DNA-binding NarL/FixJ family response regulator
LAYPTFSSQEVRISALLKSGLSTKDISNLLSIHIRTVENHRFSIRKKMGLEPKKDLSLALQQFD